MTVRIACAQLDLAVGEVTANRATALTAIEHAAAGGAELVVLPELTNSGYAFTDLETARRCAEGLDGPTVRQWRTASRRLGIVLVGGFCEAGDEALPRNSAVIIEDGEVLTVYRKAHLWDAEPRYFTPGDVAPEVVPTSLGRLATMICYDLEFPEYARLPALAGAQLLAAPTNWPTEPAPADATPIEIVRVQANAAVNRMCVAACDRVGAENGVEFLGGSVIVDAGGWQRTERLRGAGLVIAEVDLDAALDKHTSAGGNHVFDDRRTELY